MCVCVGAQVIILANTSTSFDVVHSKISNRFFSRARGREISLAFVLVAFVCRGGNGGIY